MKKVEIYTDGACKGNPGAGGYGTILVYNGVEKELTGGYVETTNNRMELMAVIVGLKALKEPCEVTLYSDSKYLVDSISKGWVYGWRNKGWKKSDGSQALNVDLWKEILLLNDKHKVNYIWVKGHAGHDYNERCDALAVLSAEKAKELGKDV